MSNFKWVWQRVSTLKWKYLILFSFIMIEALSTYTTMFLGKYVIDDVFIKGEYKYLPILVVLSALSIVIYSACHMFNGTYKINIKNYISRIFIDEFMRHIYQMEIKSYQNQRSGKLIQNLTGDVESVSVAFSQSIPNGIQQVFSLLLLLITLGIAFPIILLVIIIISPLYIILGKHFGPRLKAKAKDVQEMRSQLIVHLEESISGTREVIAFNRMKWETDIYNRLFSGFFTKVMEEGKLTNKQLFYSEPIKRGVSLIVLIYGGFRVMQGSISLGMFWVIYSFCSNLMRSVQGVYQFVMGLPGMMSNVERLRGVMDEKNQSDGVLPLNDPIQELQFQNVMFKYEEDRMHVLQDAVFSVPVGRKVALVGASGGGKSTIAQLLIRFFDPTGGNILVNSIPLNQIKRSDWRQKISIVFQDTYLFPDTIKNNLLLGRHVSEDALFQACKIAQIHDTITSLPDGYNTVLGERGMTMSGGQKQRLAIARSIISNAEILILDEATSALDFETERQVQKNLDELRKGKTTVIIAHRLSTVQNADRIFVIDHGKVVEEGVHEELLARDSIYKQLIEAQMTHSYQ
ncbi:MAG: hypothetical protein JWN30_2732 [Bacilli bacterium]|nr:hypothetical protein [Bacilli bacterium]